jgi:hypothetical protein
MQHRLLLVLAGLVGCRAPTRLATAPRAEVAPAALRVDATTHRLRLADGIISGTIPFRYTNVRRQPAAVAVCRRPLAPALERWDGQHWIRAYEPVHLSCRGRPLLIAPGASVDDTLHVGAGVSGTNLFPQFTVPEVPGQYRLVWWVADAANAVGGGERNAVGALRPEAERVSNAFELQLDAP